MPKHPRVRVPLLLAGVVLPAVACPTEPCACEPPIYSLVVHGTVRLESTGAPVPGVIISVVVGEDGAPVRACNYPAPSSPESPPPVQSDAAGLYSLTIASHFKGRRCLQLTAIRESEVPVLFRRIEDLLVVVGSRPGFTDSINVGISMVPRPFTVGSR